jgi:hypothetical protein
LVDQAAWGGWIVQQFREAFEAQSFIVPLKNVLRATPLFDVGGYRTRSWEAFWNQGIISLSGLATRTVKGFGQGIVAGGAALTVTPAPASTAALGLIVTVSDALNTAPSNPFQVDHFVGGGTQMSYVIHGDLRAGPAQWMVLQILNDRGGGVPNARVDLNVRLPALACRDGTYLNVETINFREIEA